MISSSASMFSSMQPFPPLGGGNLARRMFSPPGHFSFAPDTAHQLGGDDADGNQATGSLVACGAAGRVRRIAPPHHFRELNNLAHCCVSKVRRLRNREPNAEAFASVAKRISKRAG